jgi:hypothetical protein
MKDRGVGGTGQRNTAGPRRNGYAEPFAAPNGSSTTTSVRPAGA